MEIELWQNFARRLVTDHTFIAYHMELYKSIKLLSDETVAQQLGMTLLDYYRLCACKAPVPGEPFFVERLDKICEYVRCKPEVLGGMLRFVAGFKFEDTVIY